MALSTRYWKPGENYLRLIGDALRNQVKQGDFVTISEKALSTALGNLVDEGTVQPGLVARFLAKYWMRYVWGLLLGRLCHLRRRTLHHVRWYPLREGSAHKDIALKYAGFLQALMFGSEGGIDASNLPYSYVSLPLRNAQKMAQEIRECIKSELEEEVVVMITDTDKTYSLGGFHFTHRSTSVGGIHSLGGFLAYVIGRFFRLKRRSTPIAVSGSEMGLEEALEIAEAANRARGFGAGRTVWEMAEAFKVPITQVTWNMLSRVEHKPIVIVRPLPSKATKRREGTRQRDYISFCQLSL